MGLLHNSGAGHSIRGKYRVYGEGSVHHNGQRCEHGLNLDHHPLIFRHDYDSFWHWLRSEVASWWASHDMARQAPQFRKVQAGEIEVSQVAWKVDWISRLMRRLFGKPWDSGVPKVEAGLRPKDSIYDRDDDAPIDLVRDLPGFIRYRADLSPAKVRKADAWVRTLPADWQPPADGEVVPGAPYGGRWVAIKRARP